MDRPGGPDAVAGAEPHTAMERIEALEQREAARDVGKRPRVN